MTRLEMVRYSGGKQADFALDANEDLMWHEDAKAQRNQFSERDEMWFISTYWFSIDSMARQVE